MNLNFSNNNSNYDFEPDDNLDPNEIVEDLYKNFTYEELYNMSKPLPKEQYLQYTKWNKLFVSSYDDAKQIFNDIANSKSARKIYRKANFVAICFCIIKTIPILYFLLVFIGAIISYNLKNFDDTNIWIYLVYSCVCLFVVDYFIEGIFNDYVPNINTKIDRTYISNKTSNYDFVPVGIGFRPGALVRLKKSKNKSQYFKYSAANNKEYLININAEGRYYSIRNWYLISKYITLGKMSINDLDKHYEDELFVYLKINDFKAEKIKLINIFPINFSLNFMYRFSSWISILSFIIAPCSLIIGFVFNFVLGI